MVVVEGIYLVVVGTGIDFVVIVVSSGVVVFLEVVVETSKHPKISRLTKTESFLSNVDNT